ncbi:unnamed protein product [Strongylus vulgaris]|uniref:Neurotransmitter-gated ion-channel ligand-binding domain-containing protein n=1 Tax=Strongylus vulgaris TaxID=40348 RepID=A0A3P7JQA5_STRVU|nr:unnamed protein product [Strongylus vulgaris]
MVNASRNCTRDTDIIDQLLNGTGYNKFRIPQNDGMTVTVEIWIQAITSVDEMTNDFDMDIYITERWLDPALNFENLSPCKGIEIGGLANGSATAQATIRNFKRMSKEDK